MKLSVIVDMDDVLCDFTSAMKRELKERHGLTVVENLKSWAIENWIIGSEDEIEFYKEAIQTIMNTKGFWKNLVPLLYAVYEMNKMIEYGWDVYIATYPQWNSSVCVQEKVQWLQYNIPNFDIDNLIMTHKKGLLQGNVIIDDRDIYVNSFLTNNENALGVLFDYPHNRYMDFDKRIQRVSEWEGLADKISTYFE